MTDRDARPVPREADHYPADVRTGEQRHRWDLALGIAKELLDTEERTLLHMTARSIYDGEIPT